MIVVDADYADRVAFNLIVNFERMLGRRIPAADMACWLECVALDGGLRQGVHQSGVVLVHDKDSKKMENFCPSGFEVELTGMAFSGTLGEFVINAVSVADLTTKAGLMTDIVEMLAARPEVKRLIIVPNAEDGDTMPPLLRVLKQADPDKHVTLLAMQPLSGGNFRQEMLGYSLMQAMGIRGEELGSSN